MTSDEPRVGSFSVAVALGGTAASATTAYGHLPGEGKGDQNDGPMHAGPMHLAFTHPAR